MNTQILAAWIFVVLLAAVSIGLLLGKTGLLLLIAGYNTARREDKQRIDEKKLCYVLGGGLSMLTVILGVFTLYKFELPAAIQWLVPWGIFGTVAIMMVLANTICSVKNGKSKE